MKKRIILGIALIAGIITVIKAGIITVKQDGTGNYSTIQSAINAAPNNGDTVLVWPGIYYENINYNGKYIAVASLYFIDSVEWYIYNTIIDGDHNGTCVTISGGSYTKILRGFTLQNGLGYNAGGIFIDDAEAVVENCVIKKNTGTGNQYGGGISIYEGTGTVINSMIEKNTGYNGGGINVWYSLLSISGTTIRNNHAYGPGGGIYCGHDSWIHFDADSLCNLYINYGSPGTDFYKYYTVSWQSIIVDTFTVANPDHYYIGSYDAYGNPTNNVSIQLDHAYLEPVSNDLYINPVSGSDSNSGFSINDPLKTIGYAYIIITADSANPHNIYLSNGLYSPSSNDEKLPFGTKSYVSLVGESTDSTIIDADSLSHIIAGFGMKKSISITNITFQNFQDGIYIRQTDSVLISDVILQNGGYYVNFEFGNIQSLTIRNSKLKNIRGDYALSITNWGEQQNFFSIENCIIENNSPGYYPTSEGREGGGIEIQGSWMDTIFRSYGRIINTQITENTRIPDPEGGDGKVAGLYVNGAVKVDLINASVANNILIASGGSGVSSAINAELNIYNSILFDNYQNQLAVGYEEVYTPAICRVYNSDLEGGESEVEIWYPTATLIWGPGNIDSMPLWDTTAATPYAIPWNSPCVNTGTQMYETGMEPPYLIQEDTVYKLITFSFDTIILPQTDLAGNPRISNGRIDMGAYEWQDTTTRIRNARHKIKQAELEVHPNPFNDVMYISFELKEASDIMAVIYDMQGNKVKKLMNAYVQAGKYNLSWNGDDDGGHMVMNGTYIVSVFIDGELTASEKVVKKGK